MLDKITEDINKRISLYTGSVFPTDDEISIAWLVCEVERLKKIIISDRKECHACGTKLTVGSITCHECDFQALHCRTDTV